MLKIRKKLIYKLVWYYLRTWNFYHCLLLSTPSSSLFDSFCAHWLACLCRFTWSEYTKSKALLRLRSWFAGGTAPKTEKRFSHSSRVVTKQLDSFHYWYFTKNHCVMLFHPSFCIVSFRFIFFFLFSCYCSCYLLICLIVFFISRALLF